MGNKEKETSTLYSVRITENAFQNLDDITGYIAYINHQPLNAIRVGDTFFETIGHIGANPFAFRECEEIPTKNKIYRKAVCQSWLIIYRIKANEVVIIGIIYGSRRAANIRKLRKIK
jgi:plasmid stabilization system protein ParE